MFVEKWPQEVILANITSLYF